MGGGNFPKKKKKKPLKLLKIILYYPLITLISYMSPVLQTKIKLKLNEV
jgi:uncharacterized membrane protein (DUF485 family)